jgi:parallel beta-helix repeat protein
MENCVRSRKLVHYLINSTDYNLYVTGNYDQDIDTSNTVNSGLVYYNYTDNGTITDTNIGHITIAYCTDLWFDSCTVHNGDGIRIIGSSSNVSIINSDIENNTVYGIKFESSSWNNITSVTIKNNTKDGIYFIHSSNNSINDSHILDNNQQGIFSEGSSSYNRIINNRIINNSAGLYLLGNGHNNFTDNNISDNRANGISGLAEDIRSFLLNWLFSWFLVGCNRTKNIRR